jgi:dextranase
MIYPDKAFYHPGETVTIPVTGAFQATIWHLADEIATLSGADSLTWTPPPQTRQGYRVRIVTDQGEWWTAFDVLEQWTDSPRYGYLFDFSPDREPSDLAYLLAHHVNGIQFYDWMYRHNKLLPPAPEFIDPLGRALSLNVVQQSIDTAHQQGMAAMPYTAIYAASPDFAADHPDWGLYDAQNVLYDFAEGFLKIMNPVSDWRGYFIQECLSVLKALPFDGIHVDQYGEPQTGWNQKGEAIDLPLALVDTLHDLRAALPSDKTLLFNLVHNWPLEAIAPPSTPTAVDFLYCEIWPPKIHLGDLVEITQQNWHVSGGKTPIVAVYIDPKHEFTAKMVECVILASGGYHLVHGEDGLYLSDPYFPKAVYPGEALKHYLQRSADFGVAYQELLNHAQPTTIQTDIAEDIWFISRQTDHCLILNLLNASSADQWDQPIGISDIKQNVAVSLPIERDVKCVWCASPDDNSPPQSLDFTAHDGQLAFNVPRIETWSLVCVEFNLTESASTL